MSTSRYELTRIRWLTTIAGAKLYYLRHILHDWSNKKSQAILSQLVKAMDPTYSRLLIDEYVLPDMGADRRSSALDFFMLMVPQGIERTKRQWEALLGSVGLEIVKVWKSESGIECVVEARVRS